MKRSENVQNRDWLVRDRETESKSTMFSVRHKACVMTPWHTDVAHHGENSFLREIGSCLSVRSSITQALSHSGASLWACAWGWRLPKPSQLTLWSKPSFPSCGKVRGTLIPYTAEVAAWNNTLPRGNCPGDLQTLKCLYMYNVERMIFWALILF